MRSFAVLALVAGALPGAACTNDYDALLDQVGGGSATGPSSASTSDASASSGDDATTASSAAGSNASQASSGDTTSAGGVGGDGGAGGVGGAGGGGGADTGGGGGDGGAPPVTFCERLALDLEDDVGGIEADGVWKKLANPNVEVETGDGELRVSFEPGAELQVGGLRATATSSDFRECSLETTLEGLTPLAELPGTLGGGYIGLTAENGLLLLYATFYRVGGSAGFAIKRFVPIQPGGNEGNYVDVAPPTVGDTALPVRFLLRAHEAVIEIGFETEQGDQVAQVPLTDLSAPFAAIDVAGSRYAAESQGAIVEVAFGPFVTED